MSEEHQKKTLEPADVRLPADSIWAKLPPVAGIIGLLSLAGAYVLGRDDGFFQSYLIAFMWVLAISLGGLFFVLVHYVTRAGWSVVVRRWAENAMATLPLMAVLFVPLFIVGIDELYHWAEFEHAVAAAEADSHGGNSGEATGLGEAGAQGAIASAPGDGALAGEHGEADGAGHAGHSYEGMTADEIRASDPILAGKLGYLNTGFFRIRAVLYFAVWIFLAWFFRRRSVRQDEVGDNETTRSLQGYAAPALIAFALTLTFAAFDWMMTLNPHWYSTIFGVYYFAGCVLCIHAFLALFGHALRKTGILGDVVTSEHYHDLGKMLFAFIVFWTYIAFSQYMLIWYANIPEETLFFRDRWVNGWDTISIAIGLGHFAVPFFFLMSRHIKRKGLTLVIGASWMLFMHLVDMFWIVKPNFGEVAIGLVDLLAVVGIASLFMSAFLWNLKRDAMVPIRDPRLPESLAFENF